MKRIVICLSLLGPAVALASPLQQSFLIDPESLPQPVRNLPQPVRVAAPQPVPGPEPVTTPSSFSLPPLQHSISVEAQSEYDTNPAMAVDKIRGVWVNTVTPQYQVRYVNGVDQVTASAQMTVVRTSDQDLVIDRQDPAVNMEWTRELQRGEVSVNAAYDRESTSSSEPTTSGASGTNDTLSHYGVGAALSYEITQRLEGDISISKDFQTYSAASGLASDFNDYDTTTTVATLSYLLNERNAVYATLGASIYNPAAQDEDSTTNYTAVVGVRSDLTRNLSADANIGAAQLDTSGSPTSMTGSAALTYTGKRVTSSLNYSRSSASSGSSSFSQTDNVSASVTYAVDERSNIGATASMSQTVADEPTTSSSVQVFADRELMRDLTATASYEYRQNENETDEAQGSSVMLSVNYQLPDL